eukprot:477591-Pleurochrysis_carterae.AAC.1
MQLLSKALKLIAQKYPRDLLHFLSSVELLPEPEVLTGEDTDDVILPEMLLAGSERRCPQGLWRAQLQQFRHVLPEAERTQLFRVDSVLGDQEEISKGTAASVSTALKRGAASQRRRSFGSLRHASRRFDRKDVDDKIDVGFSRASDSALQVPETHNST